MDFTGLLNFNFNYGFNSWCMPTFIPSFNPFSFLSSMQFPQINFPIFSTPQITVNRISGTASAAQAQNRSHVAVSDNTRVSIPVMENDIGDTFVRTTPIVQCSSNLNLQGYDAKAGEKLANIALKQSVGWTGYCAKYVKRAIEKANMGKYKSGHAYQMCDILRGNKNFKEIPATTDVKRLPAGCVLVFGKGVSGYNRLYGHTEITTGDGRGVSDGITRNLRKPTAIFMPVQQNVA